jgi:pimeloyl-ACP methyl ester carboxylesterase
VWLNLLPAMLGLDVREGLRSISTPTLVIVGERDRLTPLSAAEAMAKSIPGSELEVLENAGHTPMLEQHERFNELLVRFIARVEATDAAR